MALSNPTSGMAVRNDWTINSIKTQQVSSIPVYSSGNLPLPNSSNAKQGNLAFEQTSTSGLENVGGVMSYFDGSSWVSVGGVGNFVVGTISSTDNAITRYDGTTGKVIQNSLAVLDDSGNITTPGNVTAANFPGNYVSGPVVSTNNSLSRYDGTTGKIIQNSLAVLDDSGNLTTPGVITAANFPGNYVSGPLSSTDTALARFDSTSGKIIQNSSITVDDSGNLVTSGTVTASNIISGPISSTDNAITRYDGTTGKLLQNSSVTIDDSGNIITPGTITASNFPGNFVQGPVSATNNALARYDTTTGKLIKNSLITVDDSGNLTTTGTVTGSNIVSGPASSTNNSIATYSGTTGKVIQNSLVTIDVSGNITTSGTITASNIPGNFVSGPISATNNALARYDTTTGKLIKNSLITVDDSGNLTTTGTVIGSNVVSGPASSTNNAIATYNGTTGKLIQNSLVTIDGSGNITTPGTINGAHIPGDLGVTQMAPVGSSPNLDSGTISGNTLTLEPADTNFPGVLNVGDQQIPTGNKFFQNNIILPQTTTGGTAGVINIGLDGSGNGTRFHDYSQYSTVKNLFVGYNAGNFTGSHSYNIGLGSEAGSSLTSGGSNIIIGNGTSSLQSGTYNTLIGGGALILSGNRNLCLGGQTPGLHYESTESDNVCISNLGVLGDQKQIRIGTSTTHTGCFIAGINGVTTGGPAVAVVIDASGQLGTISSSARYKNTVNDMADASSKILELRPVTFFYNRDSKASKTLQYGLIAEEVEKVMKEIVVYNEEGSPETVQYQNLVPMLLNELIKTNSKLKKLEEEVTRLLNK